MTRSKLITLAAALMVGLCSTYTALAITATKEYVDRQDGKNAVAATNLVVSATNAVAATIASKADAVKTVTVNTGTATNLVVRPVYANVNLVIRECETANGQKQYRLIRKEN